MNAIVAISQGVIFGIGSVVFIAVVTAALSLAYLRFDELGDEHQDQPVPKSH